YLLLCAMEEDLPKLDAVDGLQGVMSAMPGERAALLEAAFLKLPVEEWCRKLHAVDVGVAPCDNIESIRARMTREADGTTGIDRGSYSFSTYRDHPSGHVVTQLDPYAVRPTAGKVYPLRPAEKFGSSTREILSELQYPQGHIDELCEAGAISESWSKEYLPS